MPVEIDADGVLCPAPPKPTLRNATNNSKPTTLPKTYQDATRNSYSILLPTIQHAAKNSNPTEEKRNLSLLPNPFPNSPNSASATQNSHPTLHPNTFQNTTKGSQNPANLSKAEPLNLDGMSKEETSRILLDFLMSLPGASNAGLGWQ